MCIIKFKASPSFTAGPAPQSTVYAPILHFIAVEISSPIVSDLESEVNICFLPDGNEVVPGKFSSIILISLLDSKI